MVNKVNMGLLVESCNDLYDNSRFELDGLAQGFGEMTHGKAVHEWTPCHGI